MPLPLSAVRYLDFKNHKLWANNWKLKQIFYHGDEESTVKLEYVYEYKSSNLWSINADITLEIINKNCETIATISKNCHFDHRSTVVDFNVVFTKEELKGYIFRPIDYSRAYIKIKSLEGIQECLAPDDTIIYGIFMDYRYQETLEFEPPADYQNGCSPSASDSTVTVHVGDQKFNVDRNGFLCFSSPLRKKLTENSSYEIHVNKNVEPEKFREFLKLLYCRKQEITGENVKAFLYIAVPFDIQFLINDCEDFLISREAPLFLEEKICFAEKFKLSRVQAVLLDKLSIIDCQYYIEQYGNMMGSRNIEAFQMKLYNEDFEPKSKRSNLSTNSPPTQHRGEIGLEVEDILFPILSAKINQIFQGTFESL